jgi:hypothetical protein
MQMVMSMFRSPPKDAFLSAALREERKDELKNPAIFAADLPVRRSATTSSLQPRR